jgi:hypothetical protein
MQAAAASAQLPLGKLLCSSTSCLPCLPKELLAVNAW